MLLLFQLLDVIKKVSEIIVEVLFQDLMLSRKYPCTTLCCIHE